MSTPRVVTSASAGGRPVPGTALRLTSTGVPDGLRIDRTLRIDGEWRALPPVLLPDQALRLLLDGKGDGTELAPVVTQELIDAVDAMGPSDDVLIMCPERLAALPWSAVRLPDGTVLAERAAVTVVPRGPGVDVGSVNIAPRPAVVSRVVGYFHPDPLLDPAGLEGAQQERRFLLARADLAVVEDLPTLASALETRGPTSPADYDLLVLATHGARSEPHPRDGDGDPSNDEKALITPAFFDGLRLPPICVIGACFAGGLAVAAVRAGARHVVAPAAAPLDGVLTDELLSFYEHLLHGAAPAQALQAAQIAVLEAEPSLRKHPSAWAMTHVAAG